MNKSFNCGGITLDLEHPKVMGILNVTPDSFYDGGLFNTLHGQVRHAGRMVEEGAAIIDIGAVSSRPGATFVEEDVEISRLIPVLKEVRTQFPGTIISVDTFRSAVAKAAIENGAGMINDIYGGRFDHKILDIVSSAGVAYIMMHMKGNPGNMQDAPEYEDVVSEIMSFFRSRTGNFKNGFSQIILDPGFGFGKTAEHNFRLLGNLKSFKALGFPVMAGVSRKSMINSVLQTKPSDALNGTTVLNTIALMNGADLLRVHDVKEAVQAVKLFGAMKENC